jgi:alanine racemase
VPVARASVSAGIRALRVSGVADARELRAAGVDAELLGSAGDEGCGIHRIDDEDAAAARSLGEGVYGLAAGTSAVMTLTAEVVAVKRVAGGTGVSYGYTYHAPADTSLALVSIGYADGLPRLGSNTASAELGGATHPVVGRIAMDQLVLDIGTCPSAAVGDTVTLFGDGRTMVPTALDWAFHTRRSPANVTASLGRRVVRSYVGGPHD